MAVWEYKVITSGKGGFASPALLENFLNQLGKDEWEIVEFKTLPDNPLAFTGLARRGTQRDWTLEAAAAAQAKAEADQRRLEEQRRADEQAALREREQGAVDPGEGGRDEGFRRPRDTELDHDPEALADEASSGPATDWDEWPEEEELPTLFEAIKPHLRRNQRGPGQAVAIDYLAKRWEQEDSDIVGALKECGFTVPENDDALPEYFEFDGDLYWLNRNPRGQLFLNVREKPRPVFKVTPLRKLDPDDPAAAELAAEHAAEQEREREAVASRHQKGGRDERRRGEREDRRRSESAETDGGDGAPAADSADAAGDGETPPRERDRDRDRDRDRERERDRDTAVPASLPEGPALLDLLRPRMRRNRRGPGFSGTTAFLAKALKQPEEALVAALAALGVPVPEKAGGKPQLAEIGAHVYWLNKDNRGGFWINGREKRDGETIGDTRGEDDSAGGGDADAPREATAEAPAEAVRPAEAEDGLSTPPVQAEEPMAGAAEPAAAPAPEPETTSPAGVVARLRPLLQAGKRGGSASAELAALAEQTGQAETELLSALTAAGLTLPDEGKSKPEMLELEGELVWLSRTGKDGGLVLNAKPKPARRARSRGRARKPAADGAGGEEAHASGEGDESTESGEVADGDEPAADASAPDEGERSNRGPSD